MSGIKYVDNKIDFWEDIKLRIKKLSINYSREKRWEEKREEGIINDLLNAEIGKMELDGKYSSEEYEVYKIKLAEFEAKRCKGAAVRSRSQALLEGERSTAFFLGLEKVTQEKQHMQQLQNKNGVICKEKDEIMGIVHEYYEELYKGQSPEREQIDRITSHIGAKMS